LGRLDLRCNGPARLSSAALGLPKATGPRPGPEPPEGIWLPIRLPCTSRQVSERGDSYLSPDKSFDMI